MLTFVLLTAIDVGFRIRRKMYVHDKNQKRTRRAKARITQKPSKQKTRMQPWLILACVSTVMIVASNFCTKWSQRLGVSVLDYVTGRILIQTVIVATVWFTITRSRLGSALAASDWGRVFVRGGNDAAASLSWRSWRGLLGWPQLVTAVLFTLLSLTAVAAVQLAPNPGYPASVLSTSAVFIALLAPLVFPSVSLRPGTLLGMCLVAVGISIVVTTASSSRSSPSVETSQYASSHLHA